MRNKKAIIVLTVIISLISLYNLSFSLISRKVQKEATEAATKANGQVDLNRKQRYLDSVYTEPVFNLFGLEYTYKEVKEKELSLGLDLQGGMHVVLEVSPVEVIQRLAGFKANDPGFKTAMAKASEMQKTSQDDFPELFFKAYKEVNGQRPLTEIFRNTSTPEKYKLQNDEDVRKMINEEVEDAINRAERVIRTRIDKFGVIQPNIQRLQGSGRIQVELPGVDNPQRVRNLLQGVAQLEFIPVYFISEIAPSLDEVNKYLLTVEKPEENSKTDTTKASDNLFATDGDSATVAKTDSAKADTTAPKQSSLFTLSKGFLTYNLKDTAKINRIFSNPKVKALLPSGAEFIWQKPKANPEGGEVLVQLIPVKNQKGKTLGGDVITSAKVDTDPTGKAGVQVTMSMNETGARKWKEMTKEATQQKDPMSGSFRQIAVALDKIVYSAPVVQNEIPNGISSITGDFSLDEATDLANILEAGKLPAPVNIVEEAIVGPTLGQEAISNGLKSILAGMLIVVLFMVVYYSRSGLIADIALLFNLLFILGIMANFNAVLTLPGIAGILLSIAIAVDANVLINERVKEDLNEGKGLDVAINSGYKNAASAIIDSNITTLIKGFVLLFFGSGLILGFAVTLIIGIFCSLFTSVLITQVIFNMRKKKNISFYNNWSRNLFKNININFIGKRKLFYTISSVVVIAGIVSLSIKGFNFGVDFKGGRSYIVQFDKPVKSEDIKSNLEKVLNSTPEVKTFGSNDKYKITTSYLIDDPSTEATHQAMDKITEGLSKFSDNKAEILSSSKVGPTIADDIKISALYSLLIAIGLMFLYVLIRFKKPQFALGTIVSLVHVVLVVLAVFSILDGIVPFSLEIDQAFIAAILTVIGYSINDSVVVFDRIREFLNIHKGDKNIPTVINNALNDTLSRTLITGMSTIFVIIILFLFGGETIKGFSFAMLVGVLVGTYSSLCIGSPILVDFGKWNTTSPAKAKETTKPVSASTK